MFDSDLLEIHEIAVWIVSFSVFVMLVAFFGCVCGCKKKNGDKDDWLGKEGKLKPLNNVDEEQVQQPNGEAQRVANRASTANRSLPDIPINELRDVDPTWDSNQLTNTSDNCSELYATVGETPNSESEAKGRKRQAPSVPGLENSPSEPAAVGSKVLAHQYAKLSHPYARVKPPPPKNDTHASSSTVTQPSMELESSENTVGTQAGSQTTLSSGTDQPVPPPRTRRASSQSNLFQASPPSVSMARSANTLPSYPASSSPALAPESIPAGPAIMGKISASQELPYITLPIDNARSNPIPLDLADAGGAQGAGGGNDEADNAGAVDDPEQRNPGAGHFSGDSQDSSKGYTSISVREPLASIRAQTGQLSRRTDPHYATVSDDSDEMYAAIEDRSGSDTYAQIVPLHPQQPPPPSVDSLRNTLAENHSRQASSSSAASTAAAAVGSPKPEKRQANSPLPPPPAVPPPNVSPPQTPTPLPQSKLEEMYAKVIKKKGSKEGTPTHSAAKDGVSRAEQQHPSLDFNSGGYESLPSARPSNEPNYESMSSSIPDNDSASGYAVVAPKNPNYPGYEVVRNSNRNSFQQHSDPNYEELSGQKSDSSLHEPNYEMLNGEPNYEPLKSTCSAQDDPNYESVSSLQEPPYEQLEKKSSDSSGDILYATVNKGNKKAA